MIIACIISFIIGAMIMFIYISISASLKDDKTNKVNFYVARDIDGRLRLYLNKPIRVYGGVWMACKCGYIICTGYDFESIGLNRDDYKDLKWEDEPVEVFLNLED